MINLLARLLNLNTEYEKLFFKNEFAVFVGKNNNRLLRLISILLLTFLALSFAKGSYDYLHNKMNNPFTNWVNLPIETDNNRLQKDNIKKYFKNPEELEKYHLKNLKGYNVDNPKWYNKNGEQVYSRGRSVDVDDDILKSVLKKDNLLWKKDDFVLENEVQKQYYYDVIISEDFVQSLNYKLQDSLLKIKYVNFDSNGNDLSFWINVLAIVKDLPNQCDFLFFPNFYNSVYNENDFPIVPTGKASNFQVLTKIDSKQEILNEVINAFSKIKDGISKEDADIEIDTFVISKTDQRYVYKFFFDEGEYKHRKLAGMLKKTEEQQPNKFEYFIDVHSKKSIKSESITNPYEYAFNFKDLVEVRNFYDFMKEKFGVSIEMAQIESKENFAFVSTLTLTNSFVILALSLITIIIYLINLLSTHLNSIKKNLGTYKAFGLSNAKLNSIYVKIVFSILCIGTVVSFLIILIIAKLRLIDRLLITFAGIDDSIKSISIFNSWNLVSVVVLIGLSIFLTYKTINKILNKTPGDLIYNRA